jgi:hypothetical protein
MAAKQLMKPRATAKKPSSQKSIATKPAEVTKVAKSTPAKAAKATKVPATKVAKTRVPKAAKATATKVAKASTTKVAKAPAAKVTKTRVPKAAKATKAPATKVTKTRVPKAAKATKAPATKVTKTRVPKAAKATKAPATKVTKTRVPKAAKATKAPATKLGRVAKTPRVAKNLAATNGSVAPGQSQIQGWMIKEMEQLRQENADLREKAWLLDQIVQVTSASPARSITAKAPRKNAAKGAAPKKAAVAKVKVMKVAKVKATPVAKATTKAASPAPAAMRKVRSGGSSILQEAAAADVHRTYKSCWPIVFKIEEWNQKHPNQLAKVSQTMLNKSGVNFSRAKGFMDNYGDLVESYHQQIGLSKANSGKFNEVYEFIRAALGKGKKA